jgi:hypothetical protein
VNISTWGNYKKHPRIKLELHCLYQQRGTMTYSASWVGPETFECGCCDRKLSVFEIGEQCWCGAVIIGRMSYGSTKKVTKTAWKREELLDPLETTPEPPDCWPEPEKRDRESDPSIHLC